MGKTLYLECASGISGDMVVGALLDLGANEAGLRRALDSLHVEGFEIAVTRKQVAAIDACDFDVVLDEAHESHDHDMDYLYGNLDGGEDHHHHHHDHDGDHHHHHHEGDHGHDHEHHHDDEHEHGEQRAHGRLRERGAAAKAVVASIVDQFHNREVRRAKEEAPEAADEAAPAEGMIAESDVDHGHSHSHDHAHDHGDSHGHGHHHHEHRSPADIAAIIDAADLAPRAKQTAHRIFDIVAQAEAKAHGLPIEEVHFHEVGAVDSIVDVVSVAYCLDDLDVTDVYVTPLAEGHGRVRCAHGVLPVPVPAVTNIVADHGLALERRDIEGELVTPTGAAIAAAIRTLDAPPTAYRVLKSGLGSGKRAYDPPSTVRALIIEGVEQPAQAPVPAPAPETRGLGMPDLWKLETELDDCTGEALGYVTQLLYDAGALEVHYLPVFMKKNRPGYQIEILCGESRISTLENIIFENTTTIGIRRCPEWRTALPREFREVETEFGAVRTKVVSLPSGAKRAYPEHDSIAELALASGASYQDVLRAATAALKPQS